MWNPLVIFMEKSSKLDLIALGDTVIQAMDALARLVRKAKHRALVAGKKQERTGNENDIHNYMLAAQEYYYAAALSSDFKKALAETLAKINFEETKKKENLN